MGGKGSRKKKAFLYKQKGKQSHERIEAVGGVLEPILTSFKTLPLSPLKMQLFRVYSFNRISFNFKMV